MGTIELDLKSVARQSFGARYEVTKHDRALAQQIKDRQLIMSPHPEWNLPISPTWLEDPFTDNNWQFQFHSLRWLDPLRRQALVGDSQAKELWIHYVRSWLEMNPVGKSPTKWAWIDMGDALRTYVLTFGLAMFEEAPQWLIEALRVHADWLADDQNLGHGNHSLHQHQALFVVGCALGNQDYAQLASDRLGQQLTWTYDEYGLNEEGSISYQEANYHWWNEAFRRLDLEQVPRPVEAVRLERAPETLAHATQPDGQYVRIGDMDSGGPSRVLSPYTRYASTEGAEGAPPRDLIKVYDRGYVFGRSGWGETERAFSEETFFSLCFGPQRKIHGQADGGSLTYFSKGHPWLIDTGKYIYGRDSMRTYVVGRQGHNVLVLNDRKYDRSVDVTLFREQHSDRHFEAVTRDTGYEGVLITRRTIYSKRGEFLLVLDAVSSKEQVEVEQRWHVSEKATAVLSGNSAVLESGDQECQMHWIGRSGELSAVRGETKPLDGWTSVGWKKKRATTVLKAKQTGTQITYRTVLGANSTATSEKMNYRRVAPGYFEYRISGRTGIEYILVGKRGSAVSDFPFTEDEIGQAMNPEPEVTTGDPALGGAEVFSRFSDEGAQKTQRSAVLADVLTEFDRAEPETVWHSGLVTSLIDIVASDLKLPDSLKSAAKRRSAIWSWDRDNPLKHRAGLVASYASRKLAATDTAHEGVQSYRVGPLTLPVLSMKGVGSVLHVSFHGALDRGKYALPRFERGQSLSGLNVPQLVFADPTLDLDPNLTLGWFLGTAQHDLHAEVAAFIEARKQALGAQRVVLSGSSGGGFAALQVAAFLPGSSVLAFNPQTSILAYHERLAAKATNVVFPGADLKDPSIAARLDVASRLASLESIVDITFVQNRGDKHHDEQHRAPFLERIADLNGVSARTVVEDWGSGHRSPKTETYLKLLSEMVLIPLGDQKTS